MPTPPGIFQNKAVRKGAAVAALFFCQSVGMHPAKTKERLLFLQVVQKNFAKKICPEENKKEYGESKKAENVM